MTKLGGVLALLVAVTPALAVVDEESKTADVLHRLEPVMSAMEAGVTAAQQAAAKGSKRGVHPDVRARLVSFNTQLNEDVNYFTEVLAGAKIDVLEKLQDQVNNLKKHIQDFAGELELKYTQAESANETYHAEKEELLTMMENEATDIAQLKRTMGVMQYRTQNMFNKSFTASFVAMRTEMQDLLNELKNFKKYATKRHEGMQDTLDEDIDRIFGEIMDERQLASKEVAAESAREGERFTRNQKRLAELISDAHTTLENMHQVYDKTQGLMENELDSVAELSTERADNISAAKDSLQGERNAQYSASELMTDGSGPQGDGVVTQVDKAYAEDETKMQELMEESESKLDKEAATLHKKVDDAYESLNTQATTIEDTDTATNAKLNKFDAGVDTMRADFKNKKQLMQIQTAALKAKVETDANTLKQSVATSAAEIQGRMQGELNAMSFTAKSDLAVKMNAESEELEKQLDLVKSDASKMQDSFKGDLEKLTDTDLKNGEPAGIVPYYEAKQKEVDSQLTRAETDVKQLGTNVEQAEANMNSKIESADRKIELYVENQRASLETKFAPFESAAKQISDEAEKNVKRLPESLSAAQAKMDEATRNFDDEDAKLQEKILSSKQTLGSALHKHASDMDSVLDNTRVTINQVLPALQTYAVKQGAKVIDQLEGLQAQLRSATKGAVTTAAAAEVKDGAAMSMDASTVANQLTRELREAGAANEDTVNAVTSSIKAAGRTLEKANEEALQSAQGTNQFTKDVQTAITLDTKTLGDAAKELAKETDASGDGSAISQANTRVQDAINQEKTRVTGEIKMAENDAEAEVKAVAKVLEEDTKTKAAAVVHTAEQDYGNSEQAARDAEQLYKDKIAAGKEEVRVMLAHMKGESANETEWAGKLKEEIAGAGADAHEMAILGAKSKLEVQAAIDTRFREIRGIIAEDVHELDAEKQSMMAKLTEEAKKEYLRAMNSEEMTQDEKAERIAKVNAWLAGQLQDITDQEKSASSSFAGAADATLTFDQEAQQRLEAFRGRMEGEDAAIGVEHERNDVEQTHMSLADLITDAAAEVDRLKSTSQSRGSQITAQHELESNRLKASVLNDIKALEAEMTEAERWCDEAVTQLETASQQPAAQASQTSAEMASYMQSVEETQTALGQRLAEQTSTREKRLSFLADWQEGIQKLAAESMEKMVGVMSQLLTNSKGRFDKDKEKTEAFAGRLEEAMQSEAVQVLSQIHDADKTVDTILQKDKSLEDWAETYEEGTYTWRKDVAGKLQKLSGGLSDELGIIAESAHDFQFNLDNYAAGAEGVASNAIKKALADNQKVMDEAEATENKQMDHMADMFAVNANQTYNEAVALSSDVAAGGATVDSRAQELQATGDLLSSGLAGSHADAVEASKAVDQLLKSKEAEVKAAHEAASTKLDNIHDSLSAATSFAQTSKAASLSTLEENIQLNAEHKRLAERLSELEGEAAQLHL